MVTLITEKLQNQSLDDLARKSYDAGPGSWPRQQHTGPCPPPRVWGRLPKLDGGCAAKRSAGTLSNRGHLFPFESNEDRRPWKVLSGGWPVGSQTATGPRGPDTGLGAVSATDLRESAGPPSAPPAKRHCRSLSEPDELARCCSAWRPGGSKVWTPVSKRRGHSGGRASLPGSATLLGCAPLVAGPTSSPAPRLPSAGGGCPDCSEGGSGPPWRPAGPCALSCRRRLSLSQEHLVQVGTAPPSTGSSASSTPELGRRLGLLRCRSQPCVLVGRKCRRKRRREESAHWPRPSLDFLKMKRVRPALLLLRSPRGRPSAARGGSAARWAHPGLGGLRPSAGAQLPGRALWAWLGLRLQRPQHPGRVTSRLGGGEPS
ncbi:protein FAM53A [Leptonychotes weddellii]|uniref:Protein FAM53A n=1 Tax=Leptonychotes weddellii TaxID=9713 RepID=A0A7F8Q9E1_LEPWE|nr:protein FAM53A [Leptonychotes weddellii]